MPAFCTPSYLTSPVFGTIRPPLRTVRNQSSSMFSWLSVLSPVVMRKSNGLPVSGPFRTALTRLTSDVEPCVVSASCGRCAPDPMIGCRYSNRSGLCASQMCMSLNCTKLASAVRRASRPALAWTRSVRITVGHPGPAASLR